MLPTENPWPAMIVLVSAAAACVIQGSAQRKRKYTIVGVVLALLGLGCFLLDTFVLTPREVITQHVYDLAAAVQKEDLPKTLSFFSQNAPERADIERYFAMVDIGDDLRITDISVTFKAADSLAISHFRANGTISVPLFGHSEHHPTRWELDWQREAGDWKVIKVHRLHPVNGKEIKLPSGP